ncbi:MAG: bifunctional hydroxymethylpyrimidine kinase/phosphomethylpyrimidine kinase [Armatimonadetes bacterium]|nr:bifunctional hydroxymethylpyrimidine kinase/phosphomethylpyrimidine kinase [Armatimonadota bacterium]
MRTILTIAGSDPTGGAGVQADLQVIASLGCHGCGVITALTAQDTREVHAAHPLAADWVREQLDRLLADVRVDAVKVGMLGTASVAEVVADALATWRHTPIVLDPVLASSRGSELLEPAGLRVLKEGLLPIVSLVTPNLAETEALTGLQTRDVLRMREAGAKLLELGAAAVLVKGGHLAGQPVDVLCAGDGVWELPGERIEGGAAVHGTGCALSTAAAVFLARGQSLPDAVRRAKAYVAAGLASPRTLGAAAVLDYRAAARAATP